MKLSKKAKTFIYGLASLTALVLIFWIWSGEFGLETEKAKAALSANYTNIASTSPNYWAWNDMIGWIDFYRNDPSTGPVIVQSRQLQGYASSSVGDISLNCNSGGNSSGVNYCPTDGTAGYKVKNNGEGDLSGWAWNDLIGWISFCGTDVLLNATSGCPYTGVTYRVLVYNRFGAEAPPSDFSGWAWNDIVGWISFDCLTALNCDSEFYETGYKVRTSWFATSTYGDVYSSVFDTGVVGGAKFNSVNFIATGVGTTSTAPGILFQLAISTSSAGPWNFVGSGGSTSTFYTAAYDQSSPLRIRGSNYFVSFDNNYNNARYFRYRIRLKSNKPQTASPVVYDVVVNWSP